MMMRRRMRKMTVGVHHNRVRVVVSAISGKRIGSEVGRVANGRSQAGGRCWGRSHSAWLTSSSSSSVHHEVERHPNCRSPARRMQSGQFQRLVLRLAFHFVAPILEPDLNLLRGQLQRFCHLLSFRSRQIALLLEAPFQFKDLRLREENTWFALVSLSQQSAYFRSAILGRSANDGSAAIVLVLVRDAISRRCRRLRRKCIVVVVVAFEWRLFSLFKGIAFTKTYLRCR